MATEITYREFATNFHELEEYIITFLDINAIGHYMLIDKHCYTVVKKVLSECLQRRNKFVKNVLKYTPTPQYILDRTEQIIADAKNKNIKDEDRIGWHDENFSIYCDLSESSKIKYQGYIACRCCERILFHNECEKTYVHNPHYLDHNCYVKIYNLYCRMCFIASIALCYMKHGMFYEPSIRGYRLQNEFYMVRRKDNKLQNEVFSAMSPLQIAYELENSKLQVEPLVQEIIKIVNSQMEKNKNTPSKLISDYTDSEETDSETDSDTDEKIESSD
ncbi:coiled coils domain protein [Pacmanvirus S19]|nr:coiled coils domain protein [Pacmanvirus S19]